MDKKINTISDFNAYCGLKVNNRKNIDIGKYEDAKNFKLQSKPIAPNFYRVSLKFNYSDALQFGANVNETDRGFMYFTAPKQNLEWNIDATFEGFYLQISPKIIDSNSHLHYNFFYYGMHEALFLTNSEEKQIKTLFEQMFAEYKSKEYSEDIILGYCNLLFGFVNRFYQRQFGQRKERYNPIVKNFNLLLKNYYKNNEDVKLPMVSHFANLLHITPDYLSDLLKNYTNKTATEHIHNRVISEAKELLKDKNNTISEVAYKLGYEYPNYFTRVFKTEIKVTPSQYRKSQNL